MRPWLAAARTSGRWGGTPLPSCPPWLSSMPLPTYCPLVLLPLPACLAACPALAGWLASSSSLPTHPSLPAPPPPSAIHRCSSAGPEPSAVRGAERHPRAHARRAGAAGLGGVCLPLPQPHVAGEREAPSTHPPTDRPALDPRTRLLLLHITASLGVVGHGCSVGGFGRANGPVCICMRWKGGEGQAPACLPATACLPACLVPAAGGCLTPRTTLLPDP